jgi:hypothetical protein
VLTAQAQIFKCPQKDGTISFQDHDCANVSQDAKPHAVPPITEADNPPRLHSAAEIGNAILLGDMYRTGNSPMSRTDNGITLKIVQPITKNYQLAVKMYRMAAEEGNSEAEIKLAGMYANGLGVKQDYVQAAQWATKSAKQGNAIAEFEMGGLYLAGHGMEKDPAKAAEWFRQSANKGSPQAQMELTKLYLQGNGVPKDAVIAASWAKKAALQGNIEAENVLAYFYLAGIGVPKDKEQSFQWYKKGAEQGDAKMQAMLGKLYESGDGVKGDYDLAAQWYKKSAYQHEALGQYQLGMFYAQGISVPLDYDKAESLWQVAADQGLDLAKKQILSWNDTSRMQCGNVSSEKQFDRIKKLLPMKTGLWEFDTNITVGIHAGKLSRSKICPATNVTACIKNDVTLVKGEFWPQENKSDGKECGEKVLTNTENLRETEMNCSILMNMKLHSVLVKYSENKFEVKVNGDYSLALPPVWVTPPVHADVNVVANYVGSCSN